MGMRTRRGRRALRLGSLVVALVVAAALAGCGDDEEEATSAAETAAAVATSAAAEAESAAESVVSEAESAAEGVASEAESAAESVASEAESAAETTAAESTAAGTGEPVKVGMILDGAEDDGGYNTTWAQAAAALEEARPEVTVDIIANTTYGQPAQRAAAQLADDGYDLVVDTASGGDADMAAVAPEYPETMFVAAFGAALAPNLSEVALAIEQGRYLDGIVAGMATKSGTIGYVAGYSVPIVNRPLNAFMLGARSVNPDAKVKVLYIDSWYDPAKERQAALALVNDGADVLGMDLNSPAVGEVAESEGAGFVGYGISRAATAPTMWLSSFTQNWTPYLEEWVNQVQQGAWKSDLYYWGLAEDVVGQSELGPSVTEETKAKVEEAKQAMIDGSLVVFSGPMNDNKGKEVIPAGSALTSTADLNACCEWLVEGVEG